VGAWRRVSMSSDLREREALERVAACLCLLFSVAAASQAASVLSSSFGCTILILI